MNAILDNAPCQVKQDTRERVADALFFIPFGVWVFFGLLVSSGYMPIVKSVFDVNLVFPLCLIPLAIREIVFGTHDWRVLVGAVVLALLGAGAYAAKAVGIAESLFFIFAARDIGFRRVLRFGCIEVAVVLFFIASSALLGVIPDNVYTSETASRPDRHALGYTYPNRLPIYFLLTVFGWAYLRAEKARAVEIFAIILVSAFIFLMTNSRAFLLLSVLLYLCLIGYRLVPRRTWSRMRWEYLGVAAFCLIAVVAIALPMAYSPDIAWMQWLDGKLSHRLAYPHGSMVEFGTPLLPQDVTYGAGGGISFETGEAGRNDQAHIVDVLYVRLLIHNGWLFFLAVMALSILAFYQVGRQRDAFLVIIMLLVALLACFEAIPSLAYANLFLFLLSVSFSTQWRSGWVDRAVR